MAPPPPPSPPCLLSVRSTHVRFDIVRRVLQDYLRLDVVQVLGMTDIDDKIIARAAERGVPWQAWARRHEALFHADMALLGVLPPSAITRVSEHMPEIQEFIDVCLLACARTPLCDV